jgi:hypothetical protein
MEYDIIIVYFKRIILPDGQGVKYHDSTISATNEAIRYLGVMLDPQLNWKVHIQTQCQKATSILLSLRRFFRLDKGPSHRAQVVLYNMVLMPVTDYAWIVWGNAKPIAMKPLQTLQTTFLCQITGFKYTATATLEGIMGLYPVLLRIKVKHPAPGSALKRYNLRWSKTWSRQVTRVRPLSAEAQAPAPSNGSRIYGVRKCTTIGWNHIDFGRVET